MAGLVFDASAVIALVDTSDKHFEWALSVATISAGEPLYLSSVTYAEILVHPARAKSLKKFLKDFSFAGFKIMPVGEDDAIAIAETRANSNLKTPDAVVVALAKTLNLPIATADQFLAASARSMKIGVFQPD